MPTLHDLMPAALARLAARAKEPTAQRKADARAARASAGRRRLDGKLLAGALAAGLVTAAAFPSLVAFNPWEDDAAATPGEFRFPPGAETRWDYLLLADDAWCGEPLPTPHVSDGGFTLEAKPDPDSSGFPRWSTSLSYEGPDREIFLDDAAGLIAQDGIVVGIQYNFSGWSPEPTRISSENARSAGSSQGGYGQVNWCSLNLSNAQAEDTLVAAGDYEAAWVVPAHMTARDYAVQALRRGGYSIASPSWSYPDTYPEDYRFTYTWSPGSVDCIRASTTAGYGSETPLQCRSTLPEFVTAEPETGAYVVTYDADAEAPPVDVLLVSEPVSFTVSHEVTLADVGWYSTGEPTVLEPPACGVSSENYQWMSDFRQGLSAGSGVADALAGEALDVLLDYQPVGGETHATVDLPQGERVWIGPGYELASSDEDLVFVASATAHFSSPTVELHRDQGFPELQMWLTDVTYCGDSRFTAEDLAGGASTWLYMPSDVTVTWESGRVQTVHDLTIVPDPYWW